MNENPLNKMPKDILDKFSEDVIRQMEENERLKHAIEELGKMQDILRQDVTELHEFGKERHADQAWRRSLFRSVFSWIEGMIFQMKQVALHTQGGYYQAVFSLAEKTFLEEARYLLKDNGNTNTKYDNFINIEKNLRFAYLMITKGYSLSITLDIDNGDNGWNQFKNAIRIRNQLTHPKSINDLNVSDQDVKNLLGTISWFDKQIKKLIEGMQSTTEPIMATIKAEGEKAMQKTYSNTLIATGKLKRIDDVLSIIEDIFGVDNELSEHNKSKLVNAQLELDELKKEILKDLS